MYLHGKPSAEALRLLSVKPTSKPVRSVDDLPNLRAATRDYIKPNVELTLQSTGVKTENVNIAGISCLVAHPPKQTVAWPILYGFGGGFVGGSPFEDLTIVALLCSMTGAKIIVVDYRLAPEHPWPAAIDDGFAVYKELAKEPFAIVGESAGGNLALSLMFRAKEEGLRLPSAAAFLSPWCDLTNSGDSINANDGRDPTLEPHELTSAAQHYAAGCDLEDPAISPINGAFDESFPPCIITTGTRDLLLSQSVCLANVFRDNNVKVDLHVWESMWHVFELEDNIPEAKLSLSRIAEFLIKHMA